MSIFFAKIPISKTNTPIGMTYRVLIIIFLPIFFSNICLIDKTTLDYSNGHYISTSQSEVIY